MYLYFMLCMCGAFAPLYFGYNVLNTIYLKALGFSCVADKLHFIRASYSATYK